MELLKKRLSEKSYQALLELNNPVLNSFVERYVALCNPASVFVRTDSTEDAEYIRNKSMENSEEQKLAVSGHTVHFDGYNDQARDKSNTKYLLPEGVSLGLHVNATEREEGLSEVHGYLRNIMDGKEAYLCFFCLGPTNSEFSISAVQITDSAYVCHSKDILYRSGYEEFKKNEGSGDFFKFVHSAGALENNISRDVDKRRIYIDLEKNIVYSTNTQYAGNTVGLKKLSLRLAIQKASKEGWLAEHMFVMGAHGPGGRTTYFSGAFPSACGKTSTAMVRGETIVGDDIAYLRKIGGKVRAVNVECGIFGIVNNVNESDDPLIWQALTSPGEVIFSNVLIKDNAPYWLGDGREVPDAGVNHSGQWKEGKKDSEGNEITHSHKNARYTIRLKSLKNCDEQLNDPYGVEIRGIIYGGRDSDTSVPVQQAFDWSHGILTMGASLESETTAATLGQTGVRKFNPMSNLDFVSIAIGKYINNNIDFIKGLENPPSIFSVNYFLKDKEGDYITGMQDKRVWLKWMELRVHNDVKAIKTPTGYIPEHDDLRRIFKEVLDRDYTQGDYKSQFMFRIPENLEKIDRIINIYKKDVANTPDILFDTLDGQRDRLQKAQQEYGDYITPFYFKEKV